MKVYIVFYDDYADSCVKGVFSTYALAQEYILKDHELYGEPHASCLDVYDYMLDGDTP